MASKILVGVALMGAVLAGVRSANAGWLSMDKVEFSQLGAQSDTPIICDSPNEAYTTPSGEHTYSWAISSTASTEGTSWLTDHTKGLLADSHTYTDSVDGDPTLSMVETVWNDSGVAWIGYKLDIVSNTPGVSVKFSGPASATGALLDTPVTVTDSQIVFWGSTTNSPLGLGDSADLSYKIVITPPTGYRGSISYTVTATPIEVPEPATLALAGLGAGALLLRRRKA